MNIVELWIRGLPGHAGAPDASRAPHGWTDTDGGDADRAFAWNGIDGHEWEEFEP